MTIAFRRASAALSCIALVSLAACGGGHAKGGSQVAAKVNGEEISIHQINFALSNVPAAGAGMSEQQAKQVARQVLERLVDQEVLVQKATEAKLDREPRVVQAIDQARRQILAQAFLEKSTGAAAQGASKEAADFYAKHPALFKERKIYRMGELTFSATPEVTAKLQELLKKAPDMNAVGALLTENKVGFNSSVTTKPAEALPLEALPTFAAMKQGQVMSYALGPRTVVAQLLASEPAPQDEKQAQPFIERYLANQKRVQLAEAEVKQLRAAAKVEYMGEFAQGAADKAPAKAAEPAAQPAAGNAKYMDKGLSDIK